MRLQIIHDHDVARTQRGCERLLDIGAESLAIDGAIKDHGRGDSVDPQTSGEGHCFPMSVRNSRPAPFAARRTSVEARHLGAGGRLVDEYKPFRIKLGLTLEPFFSRRIYRPASLLRGVRGLFLSVIFRRSKKRHIEPMPAFRPSSYVLVAIVKKRLQLSASLYEILQILSLTMFERMQIDQLLSLQPIVVAEPISGNQLTLFD